MIMKVYEMMIDESRYNIKCPYAMNPTRIVIHNTANDASAKNEIAYMERNDLEVSYHFAVDDIEAIQAIPFNRNAWHAGDGTGGKGNREGIGIEICFSKSGGKRFEQAQENTAELCAIIMNHFGWGLDLSRITKHEDYSGKHCPHRTLDYYGWDFFLNLVKSKYIEMYGDDKPMTAEERNELDFLKAEIDKYNRGKVYDNTAIKWAYIDGNLPEWSKSTVKKLVKNGLLYGDEKGSLELSNIMLRILVILDRAGCFDEK